MFKIDGNKVYYQAENMYAEILYGTTPAVFPTDEPYVMCVKSFNAEIGEYVVDTSITEWTMDDEVFTVTDGYFNMPIPDPQPVSPSVEERLTALEAEDDGHGQRITALEVENEMMAEVLDALLMGDLEV